VNPKLIAATLIATATIAHAHLIDLTPGGFDPVQGLPPPFFRLAHQVFFDEATPSGWVSLYGQIPGGTYFFTDLIGNAAPNASVWWNFTGQPDGYWLTMIDVFGHTSNGGAWENIYGVPWSDRFISPSNQIVTLDGVSTILSIGFYGSNTVPETASTLMLFAGAVLVLLALRKTFLQS
jgi:hypothetical protein